jgi:hypothetical protein
MRNLLKFFACVCYSLLKIKNALNFVFQKHSLFKAKILKIQAFDSLMTHYFG